MRQGHPRQRFEPLGSRHDRAAFSCGETVLDDYLKKLALQDQKRRLSRVHVLAELDSGTIIGFYTLSNCQIEPTGLPPELARRMPRHVIPATLLGRLAVDARFQGQGYGADLLFDAFARVSRTADESATYALVVDALNEQARAFYERFDFLRLVDDERRLFIAVQTIIDLRLP
jgi:GNAT superfamily N-acetyltransferase